MIKKEYIETKRQYTPPEIYVRVLLMEGHLLDTSPNASGVDIPGEGDNGEIEEDEP